MIVCASKNLLPPVPPTLKVLAKDGSPSNPRGPVEYPPALLQPSPVSACNRACGWWVLLWVDGWVGGCMYMRMCMWLVYMQVAPLTAMCDQVLDSDQVARLPATHDLD